MARMKVHESELEVRTSC